MRQSKSDFRSRIGQRLRLMLVLILLGFAVSIILVPAAPSPSYLYAVKQADDIYFTNDASPLRYDCSQLYIRPLYDGRPQVVLYADQEITVFFREGAKKAVTRLETVSNLLQRLDISVRDTDTVLLDLTGTHPVIRITETFHAQRDETVTTDYPVKRVANPLLPKGTEKVIQKGVPGSVVKTYDDTFAGGKLIESRLVGCTDDTAVTEIVQYGTLVESVGRDDRISSVHPDKNGDGGYLLFTSGDTMRYSAITECNASAYATHGYTASGYPTEMGNIAVDPSVFPYGTRFFIQAADGSWVYGMAVARDCGGSIKGHKIDLWFDEYGTACAWGRRDCTVYVLDS